jgi:hypothetical protein
MQLNALSTMRRRLHALARKLLGEVGWLNAKLKAGTIDKIFYYDSLTTLSSNRHYPVPTIRSVLTWDAISDLSSTR